MFYFFIFAPWVLILALAITQLLTLRLLKQVLQVMRQSLKVIASTEGNPANTYEEDYNEWQQQKPKIPVEVLRDFTDEEVKLHEQPRLKKFLDQFKRHGNPRTQKHQTTA